MRVQPWCENRGTTHLVQPGDAAATASRLQNMARRAEIRAPTASVGAQCPALPSRRNCKIEEQSLAPATRPGDPAAQRAAGPAWNSAGSAAPETSICASSPWWTTRVSA